MKRKYFLLLIVVFPMIYGFYSFQQAPVQDDSLDFSEYFNYANDGIIYPSDKQIEMLKKVIPNEAFQPAPPISDRSYWNKITVSKSGQDYLEEALSRIDKKPEVPITDSIYRLANKDGNRGIYKPRYYRTMENLEYFILAECIENKGRFLPQIETFAGAIMEMKSWLHPNHDDDNNGVLEGRRVSIDLGARKFGAVLALVDALLEDKLSRSLNKEINTQLQWRIVDTYLKSCKLNDRNNTWIKSTSNWNSVCTSGSVFTTIAIAKKEEERIAAIGSALNSMKFYYMTGFGDDGYCSEGLGYWGYGFGHYLYLAQIIYDYTNGKINLFEFDNPEKLVNVGNFPEKFEIQNERCAPFADGVSSISKSGSNFAYVLSAYYYDAIKPIEIRMEESLEQLIAWENPEMFSINTSISKAPTELPDYSYFNDFGMVISRGKQSVPFSIAIKAGHNDENHNHSDVGTYTMVLGDQIVTGDIGAPSYRAGSFSPNNKARSSWGHPIPIINNTLQSNGKEFRGKIIATEFNEGNDKVVLDIKGAYEIPMLKTLERRMENDKFDKGTITIEDSFSATEPVAFGIAIMTLSEYEIIDNNTIILVGDNQKVKAEVIGSGASIKITDKLVPVKYLREGGPAYRIGIDFEKPIDSGSIVVKYTPVF